jgi:hypothetical protein
MVKLVLCILLLVSLASASSTRSAVLQLDSTNYDKVIKMVRVVFVMRYNPFCHNKVMALQWELMAQEYACLKGVKIAQVDCSLPINAAVCGWGDKDIDKDTQTWAITELFKNGKSVLVTNGFRPLENLKQILENALK